MNLNTDLSNIHIKNNLWIKPEYLSHEFISGNKLRKLKYNLIEAKADGFTKLLTFGGAYSNHIVAVAAAGKLEGFETIGIIRGKEIENNQETNHTLTLAKKFGMRLKFISRDLYREKTSDTFIKSLKEEFKDFYLLPEGGTNKLAVRGCAEILTRNDAEFDVICCPVGTGGTLAGLINSSHVHQNILGFSALKGDFLKSEVQRYTEKSNWELKTDYHFGGYAKINRELISFINRFKLDFDIPLDPVYNGKMMYGIMDLLKKGHISENKKILAIHTGGLQGIAGMNQKLKSRSWPIIID